MTSLAAADGAKVEVLVICIDLDVPHFIDVELLAHGGSTELRWLRRNRDVESRYVRNGSINYTCVSVTEDAGEMSAQFREMLDPVKDPGYCAAIVLYGKYRDLSNQAVRVLAASRSDRSNLALICFYCCVDSPAGRVVDWDSPLACTVPRPGDRNYHTQFKEGHERTVEEDLAYYIAHSLDQPGEMPGVAVGALMVAESGEGRFFLAERTSGGAKGTYGTIGGPFHRGETFMGSLRHHAQTRLGLSDKVLHSFREGPVLACTNLIGNLDHAVDITFLVTVEEPFIASTSRFVGQNGWYSFEELKEIYEHSLAAPGVGLYAPGNKKVLFAPVRNAFEGYCLLLLAGSIGETLIPGFAPRGLDSASRALIGAERRRRKAWLRLAAEVHERVLDSSPFLYEQSHWQQGAEAWRTPYLD